MIEIGLTGGIGSGKSTVAAGLVERGAIVIDADLIVRELQEPGEPVYAEMVERWGRDIVGADGRLDRAAVAAIVFADAGELDALNAMVHPAVAATIAERRQVLTETDSVVVLDIPLLVPHDGAPVDDAYAALDGIVVIDVAHDVAVQRLVRDRGLAASEARARVAAQATRQARLAVADYVIDNNGTRDELRAQIDSCWEWIQSLGRER